MLLSEIAKSNNNYSRQYFRNSRIDLELLDKQFDEKVIEKDTGNHQHKVTQQLMRTRHHRSRENDIAIQVKARWESDNKSYQESGNMRTDSAKGCKHDLLFENKIIADKINKDIQKHVACTTRRIPEGLVRHQPSERRV